MSCLCNCTSTQATLLTLRAMMHLGKEERPTNLWRLHSSRHCCIRNLGGPLMLLLQAPNVWHQQGTPPRHCRAMRSTVVTLTASM